MNSTCAIHIFVSSIQHESIPVGRLPDVKSSPRVAEGTQEASCEVIGPMSWKVGNHEENHNDGVGSTTNYDIQQHYNNYTPWKINGWNLQINPFGKENERFTKPP